MRIILIASLILLSTQLQIFAEAVAIVHKDCADAAVSTKDVKAMYLAKKRKWSDGTKVRLMVLKGGDIHAEFMKGNVKKSPSQFKAFWKKQVFTGKGKNPPAFADDAAMIKAVAAKAGAIGYVDKASVEGAEGIKILTIN
ncbi:MAG: phosphate ABC transporter substrate-binding protein [Planctomycetes bacterium]|nr:phosphate ABC transporter substrate-binding protein [Planctomycetota bacterium]